MRIIVEQKMKIREIAGSTFKSSDVKPSKIPHRNADFTAINGDATNPALL